MVPQEDPARVQRSWKLFRFSALALALLNLWISYRIFPEHSALATLNGLMAAFLLVLFLVTQGSPSKS